VTGGLIQAETQRRESSDAGCSAVATEAKFGNVAPLSPSNNAPSSSYLSLRFDIHVMNPSNVTVSAVQSIRYLEQLKLHRNQTIQFHLVFTSSC
jgi:hypothetical protein